MDMWQVFQVVVISAAVVGAYLIFVPDAANNAITPVPECEYLFSTDAWDVVRCRRTYEQAKSEVPSVE
jgi:hypothetical protein